jgi:hypothetical protein
MRHSQEERWKKLKRENAKRLRYSVGHDIRWVPVHNVVDLLRLSVAMQAMDASVMAVHDSVLL